MIDPVLDYDLSSGMVSTKSADQLLTVVQDHGYQVTHILETHAHAVMALFSNS
jgi:glyoxylase-like metal-dependent hydrolase (beta-lactamase superfamily II)